MRAGAAENLRTLKVWHFAKTAVWLVLPMKVALIRAMLMLGIWGKKVTALQNSLDLMAKTTSPMCDLVTFISSSGRARAGAGRRPVPAASRSVGRSGCIRADGTEGQHLPPPIWADRLALIPVGAD